MNTARLTAQASLQNAYKSVTVKGVSASKRERRQLGTSLCARPKSGKSYVTSRPPRAL